MLKIIKSTEPIEVRTLTVCVYAPPGVGKTSMGFTADKPLLLDFDRGSYRSKNRRDSVLVEKWSDVAAMTAEDFAPYKTVVVDTTGRALDVLTSDIIASNPKMGRGGALSLQGYGELKSKFVAWIKLVRSFGLDVVLLAHSDEQRSGDEVIERLDMQGGSKNEIYKAADVMGRIYLANGRRTLNLSPTDTAFGKNPGQLPAMEVPDYSADPSFLATVIAQTKAALNTLTAEQAKAAAEQGEWQERIAKAANVDEFNALIEPIKGASEAVRDTAKRMLVKAATAKGCAFDKAAGVFTGPAPAGKPLEREPGADEEEAANRAAAAPLPGESPELPGVGKGAKKGKAA